MIKPINTNIMYFDPDPELTTQILSSYEDFKKDMILEREGKNFDQDS
jgi:hypothetical protein